MREFWKAIAHALEAGEPVCLVSLLASGGSTPRGAGALMAVFSDGSAAGTIGGGAVELEAQRLAAQTLRTGTDTARDYRFVKGGETGMVCGGDVTVQFQALRPTAETAGVFRALAGADARGQDAWLVRKLEGERIAAMRAVTQGDIVDSELAPLLREGPVLTEEGWFAIPAVRAGWVHIFGGGHVSRALTAALAPLGFRCAVYDDRAEFADPARFPPGTRVALCDFEKLNAPIAPGDYVVVMTRGHQADCEVLSQVLRSGAKYLGCIGSRKKLALCKERLLAAGFTEADYAPLHAPIGLAIGADTPEEIAVSVAAELIAVRAGARP